MINEIVKQAMEVIHILLLKIPKHRHHPNRLDLMNTLTIQKFSEKIIQLKLIKLNNRLVRVEWMKDFLVDVLFCCIKQNDVSIVETTSPVSIQTHLMIAYSLF